MKKKVALIAVAALMTLTGCSPDATSSAASSKEEASSSASSSASSTKSSSSSSSSSKAEDSSVKVKTALPAPVVTASTTVSGEVNWEDIDGAFYYLVFVNDDTTGVKVSTTSYKVPLTDKGAAATVKVKAIAEASDENYLDSDFSAAVTVNYIATTKDAWSSADDFKEEWSASTDVLSSVNEGLDLKAGQSMAILKTISTDKPYLQIALRDFEGQENGETGAKVKVMIDGTVIQAMNHDTDTITLDKNCGRTTLGIYDLSDLKDFDYSKPHVVRIAETSSYSNHCVVINAAFLDKSLKETIATATKANYWGRDFTKNWNSETNPKDGVSKPTNINDDASWIKVGSCDEVEQGIKLQNEASVMKLVTITDKNCYMTIAVRNFGGADEDFGGGVMVNGNLIKAIGDTNDYFTKKTSNSYFEGAGDGGEVAAQRTYDLSSYIGKTVWVSIANLKCYATKVDRDNEDLVLGSVSFAGKRTLTETTTFNTTDIASFETESSLMMAGAWTIFNEGVSFRTNDFASGVSEQIDLSSITEGKHVYAQTYWRSLIDDNVNVTFQTMVNGGLKNTYKDYLTRDRDDNFAVVGIDLTSEVGKVANWSIHIPSRNNRVVLSKIVYTVTDEDIADDKLSYQAAEDKKDTSYSNGEFTWGHDYTNNWGGEMGESNLKYAKILDSGWTVNEGGDANDGFGEGLKLGHGSSISKTLAIDEKHATMAFGARTFGNDFKGEVTVKEGENEAVKLKAIGYSTEYFTKNGAVTKLDTTGDDCQNAVMYVYDLSSYLNKKVTISIKNLAGNIVGDDKDNDGYDDRLVLSSIGFSSILKVTESMSWEAKTVKELGDNTALQVIPVGPYSIYNEGINFRTQEFASGFTRSFDLSDTKLSGKKVIVKVGLRNFKSDGEDIVIQSLLNGALAKQAETIKINEVVKELEFDLSAYAGKEEGKNINLGIHIPSQTYRIVLTGLSVTVGE